MLKFTMSLFCFIMAIVLLSTGQAIIIPFLTAVFLWYLMSALATYYRKVIPIVKISESKVFRFLSFILSIATVFGLVYLLIKEVNPTLNIFMKRLPDIQFKLSILNDAISSYLHLSRPLPLPDFSHFAMGVGNYLTQAFSSMGMVLVYILFLFIEQNTFKNKFNALFPNKSQNKKVHTIISEIDENMKRYLFIKTVMSLITSIFAYFLMQYFNLEFAGFFAFVIFITGYIPTFGAFIGFSLPLVYSLLQFNTLNPCIIMASGFILAQIIIGNLIEPRYMGKTLNLSTLAILINLVFWGIIWGPIGMFFSVPLLVALLVITAQFDHTRPIAILLSSDGKIPEKD